MCVYVCRGGVGVGGGVVVVVVVVEEALVQACARCSFSVYMFSHVDKNS